MMYWKECNVQGHKVSKERMMHKYVCSVTSIWVLHIVNLLVIHMLSQQTGRADFLSRLAFLPKESVPWQISFPVFVLRMMSFSLDLHHLRTGRGVGISEPLPSGHFGELKLEKVFFTSLTFSLVLDLHRHTTIRHMYDTLSTFFCWRNVHCPAPLHQYCFSGNIQKSPCALRCSTDSML